MSPQEGQIECNLAPLMTDMGYAESCYIVVCLSILR